MAKGKLILTNQQQDSDKNIPQEQDHQSKSLIKKNKKIKKHEQNITDRHHQQQHQHQSNNKSKKSFNNNNNNNSNLLEKMNSSSSKHNNKVQNRIQSQQQEQNDIIHEQKDQNDEENYDNHQQQQQQSLNKVKLKHLAIALPDSILQLPQTSQLRAYFISQIARISSIFKVDQIIILKDHAYVSKSEAFNPSEYMARNLQYLETPQYLRKHLFKLHPDLKNAGLMNPIQAHHHLKSDEVCEFREGVAVDRPAKKGSGSWIDIGLKQQAKMDQLVLPLTRVTLRLKNYDDPDAPFYQATAISKRIPRIQKNLYWGYDVRIAKNLKDMFNTQKSILNQSQYNIKILCNHTDQTYSLPKIQHFYQISQQLQDASVLIFFSGTDDLINFIQKDSRSKITKENAINMFDCCMKIKDFGVKQLRIEQQLFISLSKICQYTY